MSKTVSRTRLLTGTAMLAAVSIVLQLLEIGRAHV